MSDSLKGDVGRAEHATEFVYAETNVIHTTIILPAYNEEPALPTVLEDIFAHVDHDYEIIIVDDGSTDNTAQVVNQYPCRLIQHETNQGKGAAVRTGIKQALGKYIIVMDADATYPACAIPELVNLLTDYDLVRCVRQEGIENMPRLNQVGNRIFGWLMTGSGLQAEDQLSGLYGLHRDMLQKMNLESDGFDLEAEISIKARVHQLSVTTLPIKYQPRLGEKKLHAWKDGLNIFERILFLVLVYNPVKVFIIPGLTFTMIALIGAWFLRGKGIVTPYFGLGIHSFILATLGILAGLQLIIFGIAAALYGLEAGYKPRRWLIFISSRPVRMGISLIGFLLFFIGLVGMVVLGFEWFLQGRGAFTNTRGLVLIAVVLVLGLQLLSASLFVSIFSGRISKVRDFSRD
jgi:glycosyltransferase involved in cell wall biosynthesis